MKRRARRAISLAPHFRPLRELPAWNVRRGYSTFLTLEFGKPHLRIREPIPTARIRSLRRRGVSVRGEWHLWIYCCDWRVLRGRTRVGGSESEPSTERAAHELQGQKLLRVRQPRPGATRFVFELGAVLETRPYPKHPALDQWLLYDPRGKVLILRGDGLYSYESGKVRSGDERWHRAR